MTVHKIKLIAAGKDFLAHEVGEGRLILLHLSNNLNFCVKTLLNNAVALVDGVVDCLAGLHFGYKHLDVSAGCPVVVAHNDGEGFTIEVLGGKVVGDYVACALFIRGCLCLFGCLSGGLVPAAVRVGTG